MKGTYRLSTDAQVHMHRSKWRKEQPFILNHTSRVRMLTKCERNLPAEYVNAQVHTAASGEKKNIHS